MRQRLKFHIVGIFLLISHVAHAFILLTASMDDVKRIAKKFVSESLADKITDMLAKASEQMNTKLSEENEQNEDEFENISNELLSNLKQTDKEVARQRFQTKSKREDKEEFTVATDNTNFDKSYAFAQWDQQQMNEVSKEERQHNVDFDQPKAAYHDEDRLIDEEFDRGNRGNVRMNKQNDEQDDTDHELENVRFDHGHELSEYNHESEKPTNDFDIKFDEKSNEESKEATQHKTESKRDIGKTKDIKKKAMEPKKDVGMKRDIELKKDTGPKKDIEPKTETGTKKFTELQESEEKQDKNESQSSDEQKIEEDSDTQSSEGKMKKILRQAIEPTTSEKSRYIHSLPTTTKKHSTSDKPKEKKKVKRPHHRLADSDEIKDDVLSIPGNEVPFLKAIDEKDSSEKAERRGNMYLKNLLATSGPIALPKIKNKLIDQETNPVESESWI